MTVNLSVHASIVDIRVDTPKASDVLFVDTNVWLWQTYGVSTNPKSEKAKRAYKKSIIYTGYLSQAIAHQAQLKYSSLILAELAHVIEKTEFDIFKRRQQIPSLQAKAYRHNYPNERESVATTVELAWGQVSMLASSADLTVDERLGNIALQRFQTQALDGYDLFLLEAISRADVDLVQVLTDDMDYACVPQIQVFTSNGLVIDQAAQQNRLVER